MSTADDAIEARLRDLAAEHDAPPAHVLEAARLAWELRELDAELAELVADSWTDPELVATRTLLSDVRMLAFDCGDVTVEVDAERDAFARTCRLRGRVTGAVGEVAVVRADSRRSVPLDDGHFDVDDVPVGPVRLEFTTPDGRRITTAWITL